MALMVGAAETVTPCSVTACMHDGGEIISSGEEYRTYVGSYDVCYNVYCDDVVWKCYTCDNIYTSQKVLVGTVSHPNLYYTTENGITAWHCPVCSYYQY